jgi:hypothetical protein
MWLIVSQDGDGDAAALAAQLRQHGLTPVELVVASQLVHRATWEHRVGVWGSRTRLTLSDGRVIDSGDVYAVLNRLYWVSADGFLGASDADREYAGGEFYALVQSWLAAFGARVVNRPAGLGLAGSWRTPVQWRALARTVGLAPHPFPDSGDDDGAAGSARRVLVVDGAVIADDASGEPAPPRAVCACAIRLARSAVQDVLELTFTSDWTFADASLLPTLTGSDEALAAVAGALRARATLVGATT